METYRAITSKRDVRALTNKPIPDEVLNRILQAGRMAGSARAAQPVRLIVIRDQAQKERIAKCGSSTPHLPICDVIVCIVLIPEFGEVGAPFTLFRGPFDGGRAGQNMMLAAWEEGISSCPASMHDQDQAREVLGLPEGHYVLNVLAMGYAAGKDPAIGQRPRLPLDEYVSWERWNN